MLHYTYHISRSVVRQELLELDTHAAMLGTTDRLPFNHLSAPQLAK